MIDRLRALAGADAAREPDATESVHGVLPRAVVEPASADACAAVLAECSAHGWTVEVSGARTARGYGRPIPSFDVLLSTRRLAGIHEYEPDDLTIGVAAGTSIDDLRARVAEHGQVVPLDPPSARASVGGVLARGVAGAMRRSWSTPRRQLLGLELVTGDGRVLRVGGRVVKNVAGYDLGKLVIGSAGTLGVITRAHLRLLPVAQAGTTLTLADGGVGPAALTALARELLALPEPAAALELVGAPWRLIVRYEGGRDAVAAAVAAVREFARSAGVAVSVDERALAEIASIEADAALVLRVSALPDRLGDVVAHVERLADGCGIVAAHAGDGVVRALLSDDDARRIEPDRFAVAVAEARSELNATVVVERAPSAIMHAVDPWGPLSEPVMNLMRTLRRQFDPAEILQRGRWIE